VLLDIEHLGSDRAVEAELRQFAIHFGLFVTTVGKSREGAAQILAAMSVKIA
jgi:hypothetical protein